MRRSSASHSRRSSKIVSCRRLVPVAWLSRTLVGDWRSVAKPGYGAVSMSRALNEPSESEEQAISMVSRPQPGWSEQNPRDWLAAAEQAVDALHAEHARALEAVRGVGLSGQMHGATLLDERDEPLMPCMLWNDTRAHAEAAALDADARFRAVTGNIVFPGFTAPKVAWVRNHEPRTFERVRSVLLPNVPASHAEAAVRALEAEGLSCRADDPLATMIACSGSAGCASALTATQRDGRRLAGLLHARAGAVHLSGCGKSCAAAMPAPATLVGVAPDRYDLFVRDPEGPSRFGRPLAHGIDIAQAAALLAGMDADRRE